MTPKRQPGWLGPLVACFVVGALVLAAVGTAWLFAEQGRNRNPTPPRPGEEREFTIRDGVRMRFCYIPPGRATLGSPVTEPFRNEDEQEHEFQTDGFWLAKYPCTQEEWSAVMGGNPSQFDGVKENAAAGMDTSRFPVDSVSWEDCQSFLKALSGRAGSAAVFGKPGAFRLPHEDEWEYAYRGGQGNGQPFYWGHTLIGDRANCGGAHPYGPWDSGKFLERTSAVGAYEGACWHPWGLCDMSGNVCQWCDNKHPLTGDHVLRGGSWHQRPNACRAAFRHQAHLILGLHGSGFRVLFRPD